MEEIVHEKGKLFYSMGEVCEIFAVNSSLIRFWEKEFPILKPHKNKKGNRMFTPEDVDNLKIIYHLVKEKGMTLAGARNSMKQNRGELSRNAEIIARLRSIRSMLEEIKEEMSGNTVVADFGEEHTPTESQAAGNADTVQEPSFAMNLTPDDPSAQSDETTTEGEHKPQIIEQTLF